MTLHEIQSQALQLPIGDRQRLVQSLLSSIQHETLNFTIPITKNSSSMTLDPWTQSLIGVITLGKEDLRESYIDYLEEKYS